MTREDKLGCSCQNCMFTEYETYDCTIPDISGFKGENDRELSEEEWNSNYDYKPCKYRIEWHDGISVLIEWINDHSETEFSKVIRKIEWSSPINDFKELPKHEMKCIVIDKHVIIASRIMADCVDELLISLDEKDEHINYWTVALKSAYDDYMTLFKTKDKNLDFSTLNRGEKIFDITEFLIKGDKIR
jgi:hypothetical protein